MQTEQETQTATIPKGYVEKELKSKERRYHYIVLPRKTEERIEDMICYSLDKKEEKLKKYGEGKGKHYWDNATIRKHAEIILSNPEHQRALVRADLMKVLAGLMDSKDTGVIEVLEQEKAVLENMLKA